MCVIYCVFMVFTCVTYLTLFGYEAVGFSKMSCQWRLFELNSRLTSYPCSIPPSSSSETSHKQETQFLSSGWRVTGTRKEQEGFLLKTHNLLTMHARNLVLFQLFLDEYVQDEDFRPGKYDSKATGSAGNLTLRKDTFLTFKRISFKLKLKVTPSDLNNTASEWVPLRSLLSWFWCWSVFEKKLKRWSAGREDTRRIIFLYVNGPACARADGRRTGDIHQCVCVKVRVRMLDQF